MAAWSARATLYLCLAVSLGANVASAPPTLLGRLVAAWPPVALFLAAELVAHIPARRRDALSALRLGTTVMLATIAGWASWAHMVELALAHGQPSAIAHAAPLTVDGLALVAIVSLRELARKPVPVPSAPEVARAIVPQTPPEPTISGAPSVVEAPRPTPLLVPPVEPPTVEPATVGVSSRAPAVAAASDDVEARRVQARSLARRGRSNVEIAAELGVSTKTVARYLADPTTPGSPSSNGHHPEPVGAQS